MLLFEVDFEKTYDSVDWGYLDDVMGRMAFPTLWRKWMKECVSTFRFEGKLSQEYVGWN